MTKVIVHAGFHKTGTTSLQDFFSRNKTALAPHLAYYGKLDFNRAGAHARIYAQRPFPHRRRKFRLALRSFLSNIPDHQTIILSRETFSGGMPGHRRVTGGLMTSYVRPAKALAAVIIQELERRFGKDVDITFFYTTRAREPWLRSVYGHLLRSIRLTDTFDGFKARFPENLSPASEAAQLSKALAPRPVFTSALEDTQNRAEGPAAALLDLLNIPPKTRAALHPVPPKNTANSQDLQAEFLKLNRTIKNESKLKAKKEALLKSAP
ncbi:hypothetical protein KO498_07225 [Lentibacter algarum]|uniref:hypothetical protein n=1 Tax=Lentibacter algarum TaxID=576131 RepID=UPI001C06CB78|nr:hypothetical protein [Lentibacter algarum]MBU2981605.1 hypothetical protein [Lentibacter algarum]